MYALGDLFYYLSYLVVSLVSWSHVHKVPWVVKNCQKLINDFYL